MYNYFSTSNTRVEFGRGGHARNITEEVHMYKRIRYNGTYYYQVPRGLVNLLPAEVFKNIKVYNYTSNKLKIPTLTYDKVADSLLPYAKFPHLRRDQVVAVERAVKDKQGLLQLPTGCFDGETIIMLDNNQKYKIKDLAEMTDEELSKKKSISMRETPIGRSIFNDTIISAHKTKEVNNLILVNFKDDSDVICTIDHPFMMIDGIYKKASQLQPGDVLMPYSPSSDDVVNSQDWFTIDMTLPLENDEGVPVYDLEIDTDHNYVVQTSKGHGVFVHNSGKTEIMASTIKLLQEENPDMKTLVIEPTGLLRDNTSARFNGYHLNSKVYNDTRGNLSSNITVAHTSTLLNDLEKNPLLLKDVQAVFWDECFKGSTKVLLPSGKEVSLEDIYKDDRINEVVSFDNHYGIVSRRILRKIKKVNSDNVWKQVNYFDPLNPDEKRSLLLTPSHKILTTRGYIKASELKENEQIFILDNFSYYDYLIKSKFSYEEHHNSDSYVKMLSGNDFYPYKVFKKEATKVAIVTSITDKKVSDEFRYNLETEIDHNYIADGVVVSNCHHLQSNSWNTLNLSLPNVEYNISLSALAVDEGNIKERNVRNLSYPEAQVVGVSGPALLYIPVKYYIDRGYLARPIVMQMNNKTKLSPKNEGKEHVWAAVRKDGLESASRTNLTAKVTNFFIKKNRKVLILVGTKSQGKAIAEALGTSNKNLHNRIGVSYGGGESYIYEDTKLVQVNTKKSDEDINIFDMYANDELLVMIATSHMDEGADIKNLDVVILAGGGKKPRRIIQRVGRVLRKTKNGKYAYIIDFSDDGLQVLKRQSEYRLELYKDLIDIDPRYIFTSIDMNRLSYEFSNLEK